MVSAEAFRPGDVLTASNGKTVEVVNTDAEGRLTMADALVFAEKLRPDAIVDVATLTGACIVGLGDKIAGLWSGDEALASALLEASAASGDRAWRMPLASAEYQEHTKSKIADLTNCGPRAGGAITAALFLKEFVSDATPWAHIDIAGPAWSDKAGASGFGVKLLTHFVRAQGAAPRE
jgi:leucyl aminopeptidase